MLPAYIYFCSLEHLNHLQPPIIFVNIRLYSINVSKTRSSSHPQVIIIKKTGSRWNKTSTNKQLTFLEKQIRFWFGTKIVCVCGGIQQTNSVYCIAYGRKHSMIRASQLIYSLLMQFFLNKIKEQQLKAIRFTSPAVAVPAYVWPMKHWGLTCILAYHTGQHSKSTAWC